jgi:hypothetical protein
MFILFSGSYILSMWAVFPTFQPFGRCCYPRLHILRICFFPSGSLALIPDRGERGFSIRMQTDSGVHPTPYLVSFTGANEAGAWVLCWGSLSGPQLVLPLYAFSVSTEGALLWPLPVWLPVSFVSLCKFLGAFAKSRRVASSCVCPSVCLFVPPTASPHGTARLPLVVFSWNLMFEYFPKISRGNSSLIKFDKNSWYFKLCR